MTTSIAPPTITFKTQQTTPQKTVPLPSRGACMVGPCYTILDAANNAGAINVKAKVATPAAVLGSDTAAVKDVAGLTLKVSVDGGPDQSVKFPDILSDLTKFSLAANLVTTLLDEGLIGVAVTKVGNQVKFVSTATGDGASILLKKATMRLRYKNATGAFAVADTLKNGTDGDATVGTIVAVDAVNRYLIVTLTGKVPVNEDDLKVNAGGQIADADGDGVTVYSELGIAPYVDLTLTGAATYRNQDLTIPFSTLPADKGSVSKMVFDPAEIALYRKQNGVLKLFEVNGATLRHRKLYAAGLTSHQAERLAPAAAGAADKLQNGAVVYVSLPGINGSAITVEHKASGAGLTVDAWDSNVRKITVNIVDGVSTAAQVVAAVNAKAGVKDNVIAYACGDGTGVAKTVVAAGRLANRAVNSTPAAILDVAGKVFDDGDGDSVSPYFYAAGQQASVTIGSGTSALTFIAKGAPSGSYHGVLGNTLTVELVAGAGADVKTGTDIKLFIDGRTAAVLADAYTLEQVSITAGGTGAVSVQPKVTLAGGADPVNFLSPEGRAKVVGERTAKHFAYARIRYIGLVGTLALGDTVKVGGAAGTTIGTIAELDTTAKILFLTPGAGYTQGLVAAGATLTDTTANPVATFVVVEVSEKGVNAGDTLLLTFDTFGIPGDTVDKSQTGATVQVTFTATTKLGRDTAAGADTAGSACKQINDAVKLVYPTITIASLVANNGIDDPTAVLQLDLTTLSARQGLESSVTLSGTAVEKLFGLMPHGSTYAGTYEGAPYKTQVGDELYNGATKLGRIVAIDNLTFGAGAAFTGARLKLDTDSLSITGSYGAWWVKSKNITVKNGAPVAVGGADRPLPAVVYDTTTAYVTANQSRLADGTRADGATYSLYVAYTALRTDVSAGALLAFKDVADLTDQIGPVSPKNPLAYAVSKALAAAPNLQVHALGVGNFSAAEPEGTLAAYKAAAEALEAKDSYSIVLLTRARDVADHFDAWADAQFLEGKPRVIWTCQKEPTEAESATLQSGEGTLSALNTIVIDGTVNVTELLEDAGFDPQNDSWSDYKAKGLYLRISSTPYKYSVALVVGNQVTLVTAGFDPGENDDGFYATAALDPDAGVFDPTGEQVTFRLRGATLSDTTSVGKLAICKALAKMGQTYASQRVRFMQPPLVKDIYNGVEQTVPSYYVAAALAGLRASQPAQQPLSNFSIPGFSGVVGANERFSPTQMNEAAGGGVWWIVQPEKGAELISRHQLTTDVSTVESREDSIVTAIDTFAKYITKVVSPYTGKYNIDNPLLDAIGVRVQGAINLVLGSHMFTKLVVSELRQNPDNQVRVRLGFKASVPYPCNAIDIVLNI